MKKLEKSQLEYISFLRTHLGMGLGILYPNDKIYSYRNHLGDLFPDVIIDCKYFNRQLNKMILRGEYSNGTLTARVLNNMINTKKFTYKTYHTRIGSDPVYVDFEIIYNKHEKGIIQSSIPRTEL